jgi:alpha-L-fucosidase
LHRAKGEMTMDRELNINVNTVPVSEEKRYKYFLNGKTYYYTKDELREYLKDLYWKNNESFDEYDLERYIEIIKKYDGDPFGNLKNFPEAYKIAHKAIDMGIIPIH